MANPFKKRAAAANSTENERLVAKITADLPPLQARLAEIERDLSADDLVLPAYLGEAPALEKQSALRAEQAAVQTKIAEASRALEVARSIVQRDTQARVAARREADIEAHRAKLDKRTDVGRKLSEAVSTVEAARQELMDLNEEIAVSYTALTGSSPGFGLLTGTSEIHKLIAHEFFRVSASEFVGGGISDKPQRPSLPGSMRPDNVYRVPTAEQRALPPQKWMPSLVEVLEETARWDCNIVGGKARYDGRPIGTAEEEPADPALWPVPGPQPSAPAPETPAKSPFIEGLPVASSDKGLEEILGTAAPASVKPPVQRKGSFKVGGVTIESSVDDGDSYTPEQIDAYQRERLRNAPKGYPPPARKINLGEL